MSRLATYVRQHHLAIVALFIALGGVSYAAVNLPNNSVGSGEIKKNAVKAPEIAKDAVGTGEVKKFSLLCNDFKRGQPACRAGGVTVRSNQVTLEGTCFTNIGNDRVCSFPARLITASCNSGERAIGGGHEGLRQTYPEPVAPGDVGRYSFPTERGVDRPNPTGGTPTGWTVEAEGSAERYKSTTDPPAPTFTVYALCAS